MFHGLLLLALISLVEGFSGAEHKPYEQTSLSLVQLGAARQKGATRQTIATETETSTKEASGGVPCSGASTSSQWNYDSGHIISTTVDTSICGFTTGNEPVYIPTLHGNNSHWTAYGASMVNSPSHNSFPYKLKQSTLTSIETAAWDWHLNWFAHPYGKRTTSAGTSCAGETGTNTPWSLYNSDGIVVTVDTSECGFTATPAYFTSMDMGLNESIDVLGMSAIYAASPGSFQIYLYIGGGAVDAASAEQARTNNWNIRWVAHPKELQTTSEGKICAGSSPAEDWEDHVSDPQGVTTPVDISYCGFTSVPKIVTSLGGSSYHWAATGGSAVYSPTTTGFRTYVRNQIDTVTHANATTWGWHVNWLAMEETEVTATEDPHMSNIVGAQFNILNPGTYTFIEVPRGAKLGEHQLLISARIDQLMGECETAGLYVESMNISGSLLNGAGPLTVDAVSQQIDAMDVLHVKRAESDPTAASEFAKHNGGIVTFEQIDPNRQTLKLETGGIAVNIAGRRQDIEQPKKMHIDFLDLRISGLGAYHDVGGLLGHDDHTLAAAAPPGCTKMSLVASSGFKRMGSHAIAN